MITELRIQREKSGMRAWRLAQLVGIPASLLSMFETGRRRVPSDMRQRLANELRKNTSEVFPEYESENE